MSSITTERLYKSFSTINSVQIFLKLNYKFLGILQPLSEAATEGVLKHFVIFTGKHLCWGLLFNKVAGHQAWSQKWSLAV